MTAVGRTLRRVIGAVGLLLILAAVGVVVRVIWAPTPVGVLVPYAESTLARAFAGWHFGLGRPTVQWSPRRGRLILYARDVRATSQSGTVITIPQLSAEIGSFDLLSASVSLKELDVQGGQVDIAWSARELTDWIGQWRTGGGRVPGPSPAPVFDARTVARDSGAAFVSFLDAMDAAGAGPKLVLHDAGVSLTEVESGAVWRLLEATVQAAPGDAGTVLTVSGNLAHGDKRVPVSARLWRHGRNEAAVLELYMSGINPAAWTGSIPGFAPLHGVDVPMTADLSLTLNPAGQLGASALRLDAGAGRLALPALYDDPRDVQSLDLALGYDAAEQVLIIESLAGAFADARFEVDGLIEWPLEGPAIRLQGRLDRFAIATLKHYWPRGMAAGGRRWIRDNIESGFIGPGDFAIRIEPQDWSMDRLPDRALDLRFGYRDLVVRYLRPMPPIRHGRGLGRLDANTLNLAIEGGDIDGLPIAGSQVKFDRLAYPSNHLAYVSLDIQGSLPELLSVIDHEPLGYITEFGLDPSAVQGDADVTAQIDFPLRKDLLLSDVLFDIRATVANLTSRRMFPEVEISDGFLDIEVTGDKLEGEGTVLAAGMPLELTWAEQFNADEGPYPTQVTLSGNLDASDLPALDPDLVSLSGWAPFLAELKGFGPEIRELTAKVDLAALSVRTPLLNWDKKAGSPGQGELALLRDARGGQAMTFNLAGEGLNLSGRLDLDGGAISAHVTGAQIGANRFAAKFVGNEDGYEAVVDAQVLDLRGVLDGLFASPAPAEEEEQPGGGSDLDLTVRADTLVVLDGEEYTAFELYARRTDGIWSEADMIAADHSAGAASVSITPNEESRHIRLNTADAGRLARGLGIFANAQGGALTIEADVTGRGGGLEMAGQVRMTDFTVVRDSALPTALESQSAVEQINDLVGEQGLEFRRLSLPFRLKDGIFDIENAYANGPRLGLTMEGQIDRRFEQVHVNGVIVPAYGLNAVLGNIPLVGKLLTGGEGQGMFAVTYRISGDTQDPSVDINPMSALAPGILRRLFEGSKGTLPDEVIDTDESGDESPSAAEKGLP